MVALLRRWYYQLVLADWLTRLYDVPRKQLTLGELGEIHAERFLLKQGWIILARRYRIKSGEIDLIAVDGRTVVFVEVKTRSSAEVGMPVEAVDILKQRQISRVASHYNAKHNLTKVSKRFDILSIVWEEGADPVVTHYRSAFESTE